GAVSAVAARQCRCGTASKAGPGRRCVSASDAWCAWQALRPLFVNHPTVPISLCFATPWGVCLPLGPAFATDSQNIGRNGCPGREGLSCLSAKLRDYCE